MKLITITAALTFLTSETSSQKFQQQFPFPPSYQTPAAAFSSANSLYLPPETQTTISYFPFKASNDLQYQYLPPTGTKAPMIYPSPFPIISSSYEPSIDDEDEDDEESDNKFRHSSTLSPPMKYLNRTQNYSGPQAAEKKEMRQFPRMIPYNQPIDRVDSKFVFNPTQAPFNALNVANRRTVASAEAVRNDQRPTDQVKTASYHGPQYLPPPPGFISSTTEPAIPILRLSNEMDLDGSYSYEALGADQTHYVQHSRVDNVGTDNEEQVVEGSYSYIGDNGQTYTVHYIADANGFRATGDHLPVPPPVPEIIQRSIQYNLAEEAKRPANLQTWHNDEKYDINYKDNQHSILGDAPYRSLFTGRKPEAFSHSYSKLTNTQSVNLQTAPSSQAPVIAHFEFNKEQLAKPNHNGPIAPQITFLASQGAHVPLATTQPPISRMYNGNENEMSKLMNYEMGNGDSAAQESSNRQLWRWQYGMNANPEKTSISRSSNDNDDNIMINFNDMTPEQYTQILHSQVQQNEKETANKENYVNPQYISNYNDVKNENEYVRQQNVNHQSMSQQKAFQSYKNNDISINRSPVSFPYSNDWYNKQNSKQNTPITISKYNEDQNNMEGRDIDLINPTTNLITQNKFIPPSQTITQSYDYENIFYDSKKFKVDAKNNTNENVNTYNVKNSSVTPITLKSHTEDRESQVLVDWTNNSRDNVIRYSTFRPIFLDTKPREMLEMESEQTNFKPMTKVDKPEFQSTQNIPSTTTTTEGAALDMLRNNIFLKNLVFNNTSKSENTQLQQTPQTNIINKNEKSPKVIHTDYSRRNDLKISNKTKPLGISEILNFVSLKNNFESNKIGSKTRHNGQLHYNDNANNEDRFNYKETKSNSQIHNKYYNFNDEQKEKLRGIVKIYKTLQRNNNMQAQADKDNELRRNLNELISTQNFNLMQSHKPPLGRAGPSIKSYLPPLYV